MLPKNSLIRAYRERMARSRKHIEKVQTKVETKKEIVEAVEPVPIVLQTPAAEEKEAPVAFEPVVLPESRWQREGILVPLLIIAAILPFWWSHKDTL